MSLPVIAIIGRPNVGKSTLFNRLVGHRYAITSPIAGTTRDRIYQQTHISGYDVILVDTGGLEFGKRATTIEENVQEQARIAIEEATVIYFLIDASEPLTARDSDAAMLLRKTKKPIILIASKADTKGARENLHSIYELGLGSPIACAALQYMGLDEIETATEKLLKKLKLKKQKIKKSDDIHLAIVGRPNVGKSSLVNALLGEKRLIVSDIPGTTIDSTDTPITFNTKQFVLIDTAGLRRRAKRGRGLEKYSSLRSLQAISRCDVACLLIDGGESLNNQDMHVCQYILDAGKGLIIAVNKYDLFENKEKDREKLKKLLAYRMGFASWAPVLFISALNKKNITQVLDSAAHIAQERRRTIPAKEVDLVIKAAASGHPFIRSGKRIIIKTASQIGTDPPTFLLATTHPDLIHFSYIRYLENELRRRYGFFGTPIKITLEHS